MYKYLIVGLFLCTLSQYAIAQEHRALANKISSQMSFMKKGYVKRQIEFRDDSIYGTPFIKILTKKSITKDSLRHLLVNNGFYDFNFELFEFKIKTPSELTEAFLKRNNPQLFRLLTDSSFSKVTYSFHESVDGINMSVVLSENNVIVDPEKEGYFVMGSGYKTERITFKGWSKRTGITYCEEDSYSNLIKNEKNKKSYIKLDGNNRFKITIDITSATEKYIGIKDSTGKILSILKLY